MPQYQSFPDAAGDSRTLEKLKALNLPSLKGRRFLDVGCNEGFFCGYAAFEGAETVVGLDCSAEYIARARRRFPQCEFLQQGWDRLPDGPFDVIVLASALHYADDQPALVHALVSRLSLEGVLVLELGVAPSSKTEWVSVERGIDERCFPSMSMVREMLAGHAWKWMGPSVRQEGDPVPRQVLHVSRLRPRAYLLMQPPAYGKSSIACALFERAGVPVISGDEVLHHVVKGLQHASSPLREMLSTDYSPYRLDAAIREVFEAGLGRELVRLWLTRLGPETEGQDFAVDAYVPEQWHALVISVLQEVGYMPVQLQWERVGLNLMSAVEAGQRAEEFYLSLGGDTEDSGEEAYRGGARGFVDDVELVGDRLSIRGWAVDEAGRLPRYMSVKVSGRVYPVLSFERQLRPDVQAHLGLTHALCGYTACIPLESAVVASQLAKRFEVRMGNDRDQLRQVLPLAGELAKRLCG